MGIEGAVVKEAGREWHRHECQGDGGGNTQKDNKTKAPVNEFRGPLWVALVVGLGEAGQEHRTQGHAEQGGGELHEPVGISEPRHTSFLESGGNVGIDDQAHLGDRHGQTGR